MRSRGCARSCVAAFSVRRPVLDPHVATCSRATLPSTSARSRASDARSCCRTEIRRQLDEDDQTLLVLRVDRDLAWRDIAIVFLGEAADADAITRKAAMLRKQFEREGPAARARLAQTPERERRHLRRAPGPTRARRISSRDLRPSRGRTLPSHRASDETLPRRRSGRGCRRLTTR
jgi:hypothetical protein